MATPSDADAELTLDVVFRGETCHLIRPMRPGSLAIALLAASSACMTPPIRGGEAYCAPPVASRWGGDASGEAAPGGDRTEHLAALIGLAGVLRDRRAGAPVTLDARLEAVERVQAVRVDISAMAAELDCERARAEQAADYLTRRGSDTAQELTIASILAAAATSIAGVLLSTSSARAAPQDAVAIGGGAATAGLAVGALYVRPTVEFEHARNLLADLWIGPPTASMYPPVVWAYLTRPVFSNDQQQSIRDHIVARWRSFGLAEGNAASVARLFGRGGRYDADALRARATMLEQVKAEVDLENQDLAMLAAALSPP